MVWHEQSCDDLSLHDVPLHDLRHISFCAYPIPHAFGVDDDAGPKFAMVKAPGFIGTNEPLEIQSLRLALEMGMQLFRAELGTAPSWIVIGPFVRADKYMTLKWWHDTWVKP